MRALLNSGDVREQRCHHSNVIAEWPVRTKLSLQESGRSRDWVEMRRFGERIDSRSLIVGIEVDGARYVVKHAVDDEAIAWLRNALRFHAAVKHSAIPTVVHDLTTRDGYALIEEWGPGEILVDGYDAEVLPRDHPASAYRRFLGLSPGELALAIGQLIDAHLPVADAGFVAVDLYDGCVLYDFEHGILRLVDLDHYRPGPYVLDVDRQLGSSSYMAPEEFTRGATIDERTTVYTLGRMAQVYLGCARSAAAARADFRGAPEQFDIAAAACRPDPDARIQTVRALSEAWSVTVAGRSSRAIRRGVGR